MEMKSVQEPAGVSPTSLQLPVLVHDLGTNELMTQYSISSQALSTVAIDELRQYRCFETPQGWVLALARHRDSTSFQFQTFLWRPQDGARILLPPKEQGLPQNCKCLLSDMPDAASGCTVVVFDLDDRELWFCKIGATKWDNHRYEASYKPTMFLRGEIPTMKNIARYHAIAAVGGKIYFELTACELGVIEFNGKETPEIHTIKVDTVDLPPSMRMTSMYFVESCGELFHVVIFFDGDNVHKIAKHAVYKMDFSKRVWCEVDKIGVDRVFLLGGDTVLDRSGVMRGLFCFGASCSAGGRNGGLRGNCIYFLNHLAQTGHFLHVIDLTKGTEQAQRPFKHNGHLTPLRPPFWLLPTECTSYRHNMWRHAKIGLLTFSCIFLFFVFLFGTM